MTDLCSGRLSTFASEANPIQGVVPSEANPTHTSFRAQRKVDTTPVPLSTLSESKPSPRVISSAAERSREIFCMLLSGDF